MRSKDLTIFIGGMIFLALAQVIFGPKTAGIEARESSETSSNVSSEDPPLLLVTESPKKIQTMKVTAYCPCEKCCGQYADGTTSTGKNAHTTRGVAADPKLLPYGTKLSIPGIGILPVDDTGGAMRQSAKKGIYHIDVRFPTHQEALNWGVKNLPVEILN
jgi:3D (Asp-Asp-Asp) domain-containing protein